MRVVDYIAKYLQNIKTTHVFGVGGANIEDLFDAFYHNAKDVTAVLAKNEFCATCMACGYSQVKRDLGVVITTSGGGALNTIPPLGEAYAANLPVLAIIGQPPSLHEGKGVFQDTSGLHGAIDGVKLFSCVAKHIKKVNSANDIAFELNNAVSEALSEPQGVSVLLIGKDVQQANIEDVNFPELNSKIIPLTQEDKTKLDSFISTVRDKSSKNCLIIAGRNVVQSKCEKELAKLAEKLNAKVAVTPNGKSAFDNLNERFIGVSGVAAHDSVKDIMEKADVIFIIGTRLDILSYLDIREYFTHKKIIYLNNQPPHVGFFDDLKDTVEVTANLRQSLQYLLKELKPIEISGEHEHAPLTFLPTFTFGDITEFTSFKILSVFAKYIPEDASVYVDAGNTGASVLHTLPSPTKGFFEVALSMGGMGFAIGAGIGAAFATGKKVFIFMGDGSFLMNGLELHTAIEYNLPVVFVIYNNNAHAMCYTREVLYYKGEYTYNLFRPAYYGKALGMMFPSLAMSEDISDIDSLEQCLSRVNDIATPVVLSLNVDPKEFPPFFPLLQSL